MPRLPRNAYLLALCLFCCALYQVLIIDRAQVDLSIEVEKKTWFKIYWAGEGEEFSERRMSQVLARPDRRKYSFYLTDLSDVSRLRIDPHQYAGTSRISELRIRQAGFDEIDLLAENGGRGLRPLSQIADHSRQDGTLAVRSSGKDPTLVYSVRLTRDGSGLGSSLAGFGLVIACILMIHAAAQPLGERHLYVALMLTAVLALAATMAAISEIDSHPDEFAHILASEYYTEHWLPPAVDDPGIRGTYSHYGSSRLNTDEIYYLLNGTFTRALAPLQLSKALEMRLFNVLLLALILLYATRVPESRLVAAPLLITAQGWYVFSYCNSEAFALTVAFITASQIVTPDSAFNRFLFGAEKGNRLAAAWWPALLFGSLFLLKSNFYAYTALAFWFVCIMVWQNTERVSRGLLLRRLMIFSMLCLSPLAVKRAADIHANGFDRHEKVVRMRNELAKPMFNPDSPVEKLHYNISMKKKGYGVKRLIEKDRWFEKTFRSAFGVYGYFSISGGLGYYDAVRYTGLAFLLLFFGSTFLRAGPALSLQAASVLAVSLALVAASFHHSWVKDFQPQGRYLLPILPMLGMVCARTKDVVSARLIAPFLVAMFFLAAYSFVFVGLANIPRISLP